MEAEFWIIILIIGGLMIRFSAKEAGSDQDRLSKASNHGRAGNGRWRVVLSPGWCRPTHLASRSSRLVQESLMDNRDEPVMSGPPSGNRPSPLTADQLKGKIRRLVFSQPFAVLCTQGERQPYGSLVAFAFSDDLKKVMFATPRATRKYRLLRDCSQVAMLVDNRPDHTDDMMQVEALTITGRARQVDSGPDFDRCFNLLTGRHPYLKNFVASDSSALFEITVTRMLHVTRFQEVNQWVPETP